jgi:hypothetical protein
MPARAVRDPAHTNPTEHRHQRPLMPRLDAAAPHPVRAHDPIDSFLPLGAQLQMILKQLAIELARVHQQTLLKLTMRQAARLLA